MSTRNSEQCLRHNEGGRRIESAQKVEGSRLELWPVEDVTCQRSPKSAPRDNLLLRRLQAPEGQAWFPEQ